MGDFMETQAGHDAELAVRKAQDGLGEDFDECKDRAQDGYDGDGQDGLVSLGLESAGHAHDGGGAADAAATGREQGQGVIDAQETGGGVIEGNHDGDDKDCRFQTLQTGADQDDEIQLEPQEDDAGPEEFVGNEARTFPGCQGDGTADLDDHAQ